MNGNPYLGNLIDKRDTREPRDFIIRKESEPFLKQGFVFRVYLADGTPYYIGAPTTEEAEARLRGSYPVKSITIC